VLVDFPPESIELLAIGDHIQVKAYGTGLAPRARPDSKCHRCSPRLLDALRLESLPDGRLQVPVVAEIPSHLMGSGAELMADYVDQDFMTRSEEHTSEL